MKIAAKNLKVEDKLFRHVHQHYFTVKEVILSGETVLVTFEEAEGYQQYDASKLVEIKRDEIRFD